MKIVQYLIIDLVLVQIVISFRFNKHKHLLNHLFQTASQNQKTQSNILPFLKTENIGQWFKNSQQDQRQQSEQSQDKKESQNEYATQSQMIRNSLSKKNFERNTNLIMTYDFYVKDLKFLKMPFIHKLSVVLNEQNIYYYELDYNNIIQAINLSDIMTTYELRQRKMYRNAENMDCCENISDLKQTELQFLEDEKEGYCFKVKNDEQGFMICIENEGLGQIRKLYRLLKQQIFKASFHIQHDIVYINDFSSSQCEREPWSFEQQYKWPCPQCQSGMNQSPIKISKSNRKELGLGVDLELQSFKSYDLIYDGHEAYIQGVFGTLKINYMKNLGIGYENGRIRRKLKHNFSKKYDCKQMRFRFPAEHSINDKQKSGELLIYFENVEQMYDMLILSILVDDTGVQVDSPVLDGLEIDKWDTREYSQRSDYMYYQKTIELKSGVSLESLFDSLRNNNLYYYSGSLSQPPCTEHVFRIVMENPVKFNSELFGQLKTKVTLSSDQSVLQNHRQVKNRFKSNDRTVYYYNASKFNQSGYDCSFNVIPQSPPVPKDPPKTKINYYRIVSSPTIVAKTNDIYFVDKVFGDNQQIDLSDGHHVNHFETKVDKQKQTISSSDSQILIRKIKEQNIDDHTSDHLDYDYRKSMIRGGDETLPSSKLQIVTFLYFYISISCSNWILVFVQ